MAGFFHKLYKFVTGHSKQAPPTSGGAPTKIERIRKTAADEHQHRKKQASIGTGLADLKAKIAGEAAKILADLGQQRAADMELDRQAAHERAAEDERRIAAMDPEAQFLAGLLKLTLNIHFRSSNPQKPAVYQVWYVPRDQEMWITFYENGPGRTYKYFQISPTEARSMYAANSKGIHVWDAFRQRGSRTAHKKRYALVG